MNLKRQRKTSMPTFLFTNDLIILIEAILYNKKIKEFKKLPMKIKKCFKFSQIWLNPTSRISC